MACLDGPPGSGIQALQPSVACICRARRPDRILPSHYLAPAMVPPPCCFPRGRWGGGSAGGEGEARRGGGRGGRGAPLLAPAGGAGGAARGYMGETAACFAAYTGQDLAVYSGGCFSTTSKEVEKYIYGYVWGQGGVIEAGRLSPRLPLRTSLPLGRGCPHTLPPHRTLT